MALLPYIYGMDVFHLFSEARRIGATSAGRVT